MVRAPRKYHKPLTNTVSYGQSLTVENGYYAALICIWPGRAGRPLFIAKVRVAGSNPVVRPLRSVVVARSVVRSKWCSKDRVCRSSRCLGASSFDHCGGSDGKSPGQLDSLSCVRCRERGGVVLSRRLEPQQLGQLASRISSVVARGCQKTESFDVLAPGALADESAGDGIARANPGGHCATGSDIPSAGVEAFDCRVEPRLRLGQVGPGAT